MLYFWRNFFNLTRYHFFLEWTGWIAAKAHWSILRTSLTTHSFLAKKMSMVDDSDCRKFWVRPYIFRKFLEFRLSRYYNITDFRWSTIFQKFSLLATLKNFAKICQKSYQNNIIDRNMSKMLIIYPNFWHMSKMLKIAVNFCRSRHAKDLIYMNYSGIKLAKFSPWTKDFNKILGAMKAGSK